MFNLNPSRYHPCSDFRHLPGLSYPHLTGGPAAIALGKAHHPGLRLFIMKFLFKKKNKNKKSLQWHHLHLCPSDSTGPTCSLILFLQMVSDTLRMLLPVLRLVSPAHTCPQGGIATGWLGISILDHLVPSWIHCLSPIPGLIVCSSLAQSITKASTQVLHSSSLYPMFN
jgi:hypothetical protein